MHKLLAVASTVLWLTHAAATHDPIPMASISIDPDPPKAGKSATITYAPNKSILIEYSPGGLVRATTDAQGHADIVVPANATYMVISDAANSSISAGYTVSP